MGLGSRALRASLIQFIPGWAPYPIGLGDRGLLLTIELTLRTSTCVGFSLSSLEVTTTNLGSFNKLSIGQVFLRVSNLVSKSLHVVQDKSGIQSQLSLRSFLFVVQK